MVKKAAVLLGLLGSASASISETFTAPLGSSDWAVSSDDKFKEGAWEISASQGDYAVPGDKVLIVKSAAKHHAISTKFAAPLDPKGTGVVVQYEVRFHQQQECGGAYLKVLQHEDGFSPAGFKDDTPYTIMFGPDKCGSTDKVHFIFRHRNPVSGEYEEKHLASPPAVKNDRESHLYTLVVRPDNTYEVLIDLEQVKAGSLLEDFEPPVNPEKEIDDPEDSKPADWVDDPQMDDPSDKKPDDWDEDAPYMMVDPDAKKPAGWADDAPRDIPDPSAERPGDWDDEDDGEWEAPTIPNPVCEDPGCGEWVPPEIPNPNFKGKWYPAQIENPGYKGVWSPRRIPNPTWFEDSSPHALTPMGGAGIEIWTMQDDIEFDNVYIGTSETDARAFAEETWRPKADLAAAAKANTNGGDGFVTKFVEGVTAVIEDFRDYAGANPLMALIMVLVPLFSIAAVYFLSADDEDKDAPAAAPRVARKAAPAAGVQAEDDEEEEEEEEAPAPKKKSTKKKSTKKTPAKKTPAKKTPAKEEDAPRRSSRKSSRSKKAD